MTALILAAFACTRLLLLWSATHPDEYAPEGAPFLADVDLFNRYAVAIVDEDEAPYSGFAMEYPPGVLPFIVAPQLMDPEAVSYQQGFIALMLLVDVAGLVGLMRVARRGGSPLGVGLWIALLPLLGPLAYARLDLVPAVATIWAVERASTGASFGTGAALGFGTLAKLYPALLMPAALVASSRRRRLAAGAALFVMLPLLPLAGSLDEMLQQAVADQMGRGIHIESTWGSLLFLAGKLGHETAIRSGFSTLHFEGSAPHVMRLLSLGLTAAALGAGCWLAREARVGCHRASRSGAVMFATLATIVGVSGVFSPQYVLWLFALGAAAVCMRESAIKLSAAMLIPVAGATQMIYPFAYDKILARELPALLLLLTRNLLVLTSGLLAFWTLARSRDAK
ncbi:MAG TPA: glycosyltransferase 87 family protein [Egibacteraceae bacterium]|jgi:hypothetical protein|nr:glycosyltransferase 87 family protein [Egibacteraceae bacterium]